MDITIIGNGNMARGIATRALAGGLTVEVLGQDITKAQELAAELGAGVTFGTTAEAPQGGAIVVLAVPFDAAKNVVSASARPLNGKTIVDITNPVNFETFDSLVVEPGTSAAGRNRAACPRRRQRGQGVQHHLRRHPRRRERSAGQPLDVFIAGDNADATAAVEQLRQRRRHAPDRRRPAGARAPARGRSATSTWPSSPALGTNYAQRGQGPRLAHSTSRRRSSSAAEPGERREGRQEQAPTAWAVPPSGPL